MGLITTVLTYFYYYTNTTDKHHEQYEEISLIYVAYHLEILQKFRQTHVPFHTSTRVLDIFHWLISSSLT